MASDGKMVETWVQSLWKILEKGMAILPPGILAEN